MKLMRIPNGPSARVTRIERQCVVELYISCEPDVRPTRSGSAGSTATDFVAQAESMYDTLIKTLAAEGAERGAVLSERVFLADIDAELPALEPIRRAAYSRLCRDEQYLPATSWIKQPPCHQDRLCAVQVHAFVPVGRAGGRGSGGAGGGDAGKIVAGGLPATSRYGVVRTIDVAGMRHVYVANVAGTDGQGAVPPFKRQAQTMFASATDALTRAGSSWGLVCRTWFWLADIDRDYAEFNVVRNRFYTEAAVSRLPASTGIAGVPYPSSLACAMDLYAFQSQGPTAVETMHSATMNEAPAYGAAFARGLKISTPDSNVLFISGTASIDDQGKTIHVGEVEAQVNRTFENIAQLLAAQHASMDNVVSMISYLKSAHSLDTFERVLRQRRIPADIPNTIVEAGVCRPEWLVEVEAIAVV